MKLRLRGNSLRLRLQQKEVDRLMQEGYVAEEVRFSPKPSEKLIYALELSSEIATLCANTDKNLIRVLLPQQTAKSWAESERVSLSAEQETGPGETLKILVEKDFKCISPHRVWQEDESDAYPNPNPSCGG